jgi:hypothetical protein
MLGEAVVTGFAGPSATPATSRTIAAATQSATTATTPPSTTDTPALSLAWIVLVTTVVAIALSAFAYRWLSRKA